MELHPTQEEFSRLRCALCFTLSLLAILGAFGAPPPAGAEAPAISSAPAIATSIPDASDPTSEDRSTPPNLEHPEPSPHREHVGAGSATWTELPPPARAEHAAAIDTRRTRMIVFGGRTAIWGGAGVDEFRNDVWVLDLKGKPCWERLDIDGPAPSPRVGSVAIYDSLRDRILVFGGQDSAGFRADLWALSFHGRPRWRLVDVGMDAPRARAFSSLTIDPTTRRAFLFGGRHDWDLNDSWELTLGETPSWREVRIAGTPPSPRSAHAAVFVPSLQGIVVIGGSAVDTGREVWFVSTRAPSVWTDLTSTISGDVPCGLKGHVAGYDGFTDRILVYGGNILGDYERCGSGAPKDLWSLSLQDGAWSKLATGSTLPRARVYASGIIDALRGRLIVYGGEQGIFGAMADTWAISLGEAPSWSPIVPENGPPGKFLAGLYDRARDRIVCMADSVLWSYSLENPREWSRLNARGNAPPPWADVLAVHDSRRNRAIFYGSRVLPGPGFPTYLADAWSLSLDEHPTWLRIPARGDAPPLRESAGTYDPTADRMILFGGYFERTVSKDTWSLSLGAYPEWNKLSVSAGPARRAGASAIYDPARKRMVVFGGGVDGADSWATYNDVWSLGLNVDPGWGQLREGDFYDSALPERRALHAAVYDPHGDRMIVVGGYVPGAFSRGPWEEVWSFDFVDSAWSTLTLSGQKPPLWLQPLAFYDSQRNRMLTLEGDHVWGMSLEEHGRRRRHAGTVDALAESQAPAPAPRARLEIAGPNPSRAGWEATVTLPDGEPARLELLDVAGRMVWTSDVRALGPGTHAVVIAAEPRLRPGVYLIRLLHGDAISTARLVRIE